MRKTLNLSNLVAIIVGLLLSSCHILYVPNSFNSPLLRNKGDGQINVSAGSAGFEAQTAYAFSNKVGVMLNGQILNSTTSDDKKEQKTLGEIGLGYTEQFSDNGMFEVFGGGGIGSVPANFKNTTNYDGTQTTQITRFFVQPALGFFNDWLDLSVVSRLSAVNIGSQTNWFYEPGVVSKMGYKRLRFVMCLGFSIPFRNYDERIWDNSPVTFSIGMHFNFGKRLSSE